MIQFTFLIFLGLQIIFPSQASSWLKKEKPAKKQQESRPKLGLKTFNHDLFTRTLSKYVIDGKVNYAGLKIDSGDLRKYLRHLANARLDNFSRKEKLAFYINAYNACTLKLIIDEYPIEPHTRKWPANSIRQIKGAWENYKYKVAGKELNLNQIEHDYIRRIGDGREHFAMVCAAVSCPPLANKAFLAKTLDKQLDQQVRLFLESVHKFHFCPECDSIQMSKILEWFPQDFERYATDRTSSYGKYSGVVEFFMKYMNRTFKRDLLRRKPKIEFLEYDWTLNEAFID